MAITNTNSLVYETENMLKINVWEVLVLTA